MQIEYFYWAMLSVRLSNFGRQDLIRCLSLVSCEMFSHFIVTFFVRTVEQNLVTKRHHIKLVPMGAVVSENKPLIVLKS